MNARPNSEEQRRLIVGITGASGAIYGVRLLELLKETDIETHLIMSRAARMTLAYETDFKVPDVERLATLVHPYENIGAVCSSGSFRTMGIVFDQDDVRDRDGRYGKPAVTRSRCRPERAPSRRIVAARDTFASRPYSDHGRGYRSWGHRLPTGSRFLFAACVAG
jgi:hypothetical protein